jgi:hypothetical protein
MSGVAPKSEETMKSEAIEERSFERRLTTATGYVALGLLALTLLIGPVNLLLRRRIPSRVICAVTWGHGQPSPASAM